MAVGFAGAGTDQLAYSGTIPDPATATTFTAWIRFVDTNANATFLRTRTAGGASSTNWAMHSDGQTPSYFTGSGSVLGPTALAATTWHRVACTHTGTATALFQGAGLTGATATSTGTLAGAATPTVLAIGGRAAGDAADPYNGWIAHVRCWSAVLTQAQIEAEWLSAKPVITTNLYGAWPLRTNADLADISGNGRTLTIPANTPSTQEDPPIGDFARPLLAPPMRRLLPYLGR
jgi:hypothetical protein